MYQGAGKRPAAQEKQIVRASPEGRCPRPEGPRAAEQNLHSTSPSHDKQTLKISWKSAKQIFQEKSSKNALKYGN